MDWDDIFSTLCLRSHVVHIGYTSRGDVLGTIGVIGPTRMLYSRVVPIVDFTAQIMSRVFEQTL